ncbi:diacylglycerol kinase family protein [Streptomyces triticagri]|uniref:diacylglycerol kinase family protein n=1 Tax=Streptomyces triticagri TaxID=2293568 RepID=UPI0026D8887B
MSAPEPAAQRAQSAQPGERGAQPGRRSGARPLLVVVDPSARSKDGESVRIAKDVLSAGSASVKLCLPDGPEEFARALARRGARRPVVVGDDRALLRAVTQLHRERDLDGAALSVVPVGSSTELVRAFGVPAGAVEAARTVLDGVPRRLDLLVDDSDGVVLGDLRLPVHPAGERDGGTGDGPGGEGAGPDGARWWAPPLRTCQSLLQSLAARAPVRGGSDGVRPARLRVEADGETLVDLDRPVGLVSVTAGGARRGFARVEVRAAGPGSQDPVAHAVARSLTVSGADFRYRADMVTAGPVRRRTWTVRPDAWMLTLPRG